LNYWEAADIDYDPEVDVVVFGRKTKFGFKISGWGHDGENDSKYELMNHISNLLKKGGYYVEVSGKPASILLKRLNTPYVKDINILKKIFPDSEFLWVGKNREEVSFGDIDGFYQRKLENNTITDTEILKTKKDYHF